MTTPMRIAAATTVAVAALVGSCRNGDRPAAAAAGDKTWKPERVAEIYFSTGVAGYVEPCGCTTKPLGGIQRLAAVIGKGRHERALIDAGGLFFPEPRLDAVTGEQHLLKSKILARAYRKLGAVAINLAANDLAGGTALLGELQREGAVPFVSVNVRPVGDGGPSVAQSSIREVGKIKIGLAGISTPEDIRAEGVTAIEYTPALRSEVELLKKRGADVIIVLANVKEGAARELARAVPDVDVIVRAPGTPVTRSPTGPIRAGNATILEAGSQGQHIGRMTLVFGVDAPARPIALDDGGYGARARRELTERKIGALRRQIEEWKNDPKMAEASEARRQQIAKLEAQLAEAPDTNAEARGPQIKVDLVPLTDDIAGDPEMNGLLKAYYAQLKEMNLAKGDLSLCEKKKIAQQATYVGTSECVDCHEEAYAFWKKTKHSKAWATLEEQGKHFDLTCIGCHTVGYQQPGGFCRLADVGNLKDVGCENCHGPGSLHVEEGDTDFITLEAPEGTCKGACHVPEHSDAFEYHKYLHEITGEGHVLSDKSKGT